MPRVRRQFRVQEGGMGPFAGASSYYPVTGSYGGSAVTSATQMIKTQELYASVRRVPAMYTLNPWTYDLSGNPFPNARVWSTGLMATIWGHVKVTKAYGIWNTSSFTQMQRFDIDSADSPSSINGFGTSATLLTVSAGIERRAWNDATDVEVDCPFQFNSWHMAPGAPGGFNAPEWFSIMEDQKVAWYDGVYDPNEDISCSGVIGMLWGEFDPSGTVKDGTIVTSVIDRLGFMVHEGLICEGAGPHHGGVSWAGCPDYNINMHQY